MKMLKALGGFIKKFLIHYKQGICATILSIGLLLPFYLVKVFEVKAAKIRGMSETIEALIEVQEVFTQQEDEMLQMREYIQQQNEVINQLINEIRKLQGKNIPPRPPRSEA